MAAIMLVGDVDLNDRTKYRYSQGDDGDIWEETTAPRRFSNTADTLIVSRSEKSADILNFFIVCQDAPGLDPNTVESNYQALVDELEDARLYWVTRGAEGAVKTVQKAVDGQSAPLVWTIKTYRLHRTHHEWDGIPLIGCQLTLTVVEGSVTLASSLAPSPVALRLLVPTPTLRTGVNPDPVTLSLTVPTPELTLGVTPGPVALSLAVPTPTLSLEVVPAPVAITLVVTTPEDLALDPGGEAADAELGDLELGA